MFGRENYISPRNSQQYFYKISPMTTIQVPNKVHMYGLHMVFIFFAVKCHCTRALFNTCTFVIDMYNSCPLYSKIMSQWERWILSGDQSLVIEVEFRQDNLKQRYVHVHVC